MTQDDNGPMAGGYRPPRPRSFVQFAESHSPLLLIVVDTEESFDWSAPFSGEKHTVSAMQRIHLCQSLFERFGICPTYVVDYPIASRTGASRELRELAVAGRCVIGSQLHPWVNPPLVETLNRQNSFPGNLPFDLELRKLHVLTDSIAENLGVTPRIYKAGRYGIGPHTAGILRQLGYCVDMSIYSRRAYLEEGGPDFRAIPPLPFWLDSAERVLEIPLTCDYYGLLSRWGDRFYHDWLNAAIGRSLHLSGVSARLGLLNRVSISPEGYPLREAKQLTKSLIERGIKVFTLAFHSPSLEPGNTPYVRTQRDLDKLLAWLAHYLEFFLGNLGGKPSTPLALWALAQQGAIAISDPEMPQEEESTAIGQCYGHMDRSGRSSQGAGRSDRLAEPVTAAAEAKSEALAHIPTLMCINARYAQHAAVCLVSLFENNPHSFFDIVIAATESLGREETKLRDSLASYQNFTLAITLFPTPLTMNLPVIKSKYTIDSYIRLWVSEFFPGEINQILYLDADMVVIGDIRDLWNIDLGHAIIAAASIPRPERCRALGIPEQYGYFNPGVLLINLARWRSEGIRDRLLAYIAANSDKIVEGDQDVLNACLYARRLPLPHIWNVIVPFFSDCHPPGISAEELRAVQQHACIIHFNSDLKPWHYLCQHPRRAEYWKYLDKTAWRHFIPEDRTALNWIKKHFGSRLPEEARKCLRDILREGRGRVRI